MTQRVAPRPGDPLNFASTTRIATIAFACAAIFLLIAPASQATTEIETSSRYGVTGIHYYNSHQGNSGGIACGKYGAQPAMTFNPHGGGDMLADGSFSALPASLVPEACASIARTVKFHAVFHGDETGFDTSVDNVGGVRCGRPYTFPSGRFDAWTPFTGDLITISYLERGYVPEVCAALGHAAGIWL